MDEVNNSYETFGWILDYGIVFDIVENLRKKDDLWMNLVFVKKMTFTIFLSILEIILKEQNDDYLDHEKIKEEAIIESNIS